MTPTPAKGYLLVLEIKNPFPYRKSIVDASLADRGVPLRWSVVVKSGSADYKVGEAVAHLSGDDLGILVDGVRHGVLHESLVRLRADVEVEVNAVGAEMVAKGVREMDVQNSILARGMPQLVT